MGQWIAAGAFDDIDNEDVKRFDHDGRTYAVYRIDDRVYASDGLCTHEQADLSWGFVQEHVIECPKHNGRFDIRDGRPLRAPACVALKTYLAKVEGGQIFIEI
jgi:3-phenylpropionate/trans-cinnamate dioxygenase ferredoxin subunit